MSLQEFNRMKSEAIGLGIDPKGMKKAELQAAIDAAQPEKCSLCGKPCDRCFCDGDPFDDIDPETEGDHLTSEEVPEAAKAIDETVNREGWLNRAVRLLEPMMVQVGAEYEPEKVRVSVGFGPRRKALGVCFPTKANNAGLSYVFISPVEDDPLKILATLVHELIHVSDDCVSGHQNHFAKCARALGLEGKLTATEAGEGLNHALADILTDLGDYPHTKLNLSGVKKQGTRMKLVECPEDGFKFRTTQKWIDQFGEESFNCPCGAEMKVGGGDE